MRVIAGDAKGRRIKAPTGSSIRPSSEKVRSAIFSIVESAGVDLSRVLDLYAGTGALGIEALSRGAGWVDFVEQDPRHAAAIKANLAATGLGARAHVCREPVAKAIGSLEGEYGVVFMDPPYGDDNVGSVLRLLAASPVVGAGTVIVVEHSRHQALEPGYGDFILSKERKYGETIVSIFHRR